MLEDTLLAGRVAATDLDGDAVTYELLAAWNGRAILNQMTGEFDFEPDPDFFGDAGFRFHASDGTLNSNAAIATIRVSNVNDPPRIAAVPDLRNSPESQYIEYALSVADPDREALEIRVSSDNPEVVAASVGAPSGGAPPVLRLRALSKGSANVNVVVADSEYEAVTRFTFKASDVTKRRVLEFPEPEFGAITLKSVADKDVTLLLEHNGFPVFDSVDTAASYVDQMPARFPGEGFDRKLWRFLRDAIYHDVPLGDRSLLYDPWVTLNSLGWGFCGNVAGVYVEIARAAGYSARVWGLHGHVVPEILVDGRWRMYDPDLAVYYKNHDGSVASVADVEQDPTLITSPIDPILAEASSGLAYSALIADFYASATNNYDGEEVFLPKHPSPITPFVLVPGARLTYPGRWTEAPVGYDGDMPYAVRHYAQALLEMPEGWVGRISLPWMAWDIRGRGQIGIDGELFDIDSEEIKARLRDAETPVSALDVYSSTNLEIIFLINAVHFSVGQKNILAVRAFDAWAVEISSAKLEPEVAAAALDSSLRKPTPHLVP